MEEILWQEPEIAHDVVGYVGEMCHDNGFRQETILIYAISGTKT